MGGGAFVNIRCWKLCIILSIVVSFSYSLTLPIDGVTELTGWYWQKRGISKHRALDIPAKQGTSVRAVIDGVCVYKGFDYATKFREGYGNYVKIQDSSSNIWIYAHLYSYNVKVGEPVQEGQVIAKVGWTGLHSMRCHLHLEKQDKNGRKLIFTKDFGIVWSLRK